MKPVPSLSLPLLAIALTLAFPVSPVHANPVCLSADSDSDGDGWGWENNQSCIVSTSSSNGSSSDSSNSSSGNSSSGSTVATTPAVAQPSIQVPGQQTTTTTQRGHPVCSSASADSDGDGWGWENNSSCIVVTDAIQSDSTAPPAPVVPQSVAAIPTVPETTEPATPEPETTEPETTNPDIINGLYRGTHPVCSSASADADGDGWGFEFHESCKVVEGYIAPGTQSIAAPDDNNPNTKVGVIYNQNFNSSTTGLYQGDQLNRDWESPFWHLGFEEGRVRIVNTGGRNGKAMQVTYPAGRYGAAGSGAFLSDVQFGMGLPKTYEELYVAYDIRFAAGFDFVRGGKLPGLCGSDVSQAPNTGCNTGGGYPTGYDGWSARGMWRENGELENYVYHASQRNFYGDDEFWNVRATPGVWHRVEHRVVLNTPGRKNGILEAWFDGRKVLSLNNFEYRKTNTIGINLFYFSTFFGGNDISWAPTTDQTMNFDNFVMSTDKID